MSGGPPQHRRPLWLAALVTSIAVPVGYALIIVTSALFTRTTGTHEFFGALTGIILVGIPVCMAGTYLIGLPLAIYFRSRGWLAVLPACLVGALAGAVLLGVLLWRVDRESALLFACTWGAAFGLAASVVFCLAAGISWRTRPP